LRGRLVLGSLDYLQREGRCCKSFLILVLCGACIAVDQDSNVFTGCWYGNVYIHDKFGKGIKVLEGHFYQVNAIAVSSDGKRVFTGSEDNTGIWTVERQ